MMDEENNPMEDSSDVEYVCGDPKVDIRVGDDYQVEIPPMMSESQRAALLSNHLDSDSSCSFLVGLPVEVMWIDTKCRDKHGLRDDDVDMNESLKSLKRKRSRRGGSDGNLVSRQRMNLEAVPGKSSSSWEELEVDGFVLGLYTFGKDFAQVKRLLERKEIGDILSFYYGKFYKSAKYKIWSKKRRKRCIQGKKLYSDWRLQLLLSRLVPCIRDEPNKQKLVDVSKSFADGKKSLEEYISVVKELVGLRSLVEAVAIGKHKEDLTVLTTEPVNAKQWFTVSPATISGLGEYSSLTVDGIIEKLTGGSRLSKARCNDIFWDAVWPRLLHRGWHSEQPKDRGYIVFMVPGVKKFSRRKLVKRDHYFDSISDILKKVVSEPELLESETEETRTIDGISDCNQSKKEKHRYLRSPNSSSTHRKFTVVDTSRLVSGGKLCELRDPKSESLASQLKVCRGDKNSSMGRLQMKSLDIQEHAIFANEHKWERRRKLKPVDDSMRFLIVDTSVEQGGHVSDIRRWRNLPVSENPCKVSKGAIGESSHNQSCTNKDVKCEYLKGNDSVVKEETLENVQQGQSKKIKKRFALLSESINLHSVSSLVLPKRRRLSAGVRKDIKRSSESLALKPPAINQTTNCHYKLSVDSMDLKTEQSESTPAQEQEPKGLCSSKEQRALHEISPSEQQQQQDESNRLCSDKKCSSKDLEPAQQQEPPKSPSDKNSPSTDNGTTQERASLEKQEEEEHNLQTNTDIPRRQSTRKRPLTTRALEALESGFLTPKSMKTTTSKRRKRERSAKIKHSANASNKTPDEVDNGFLVNEATTSKPLDHIEDSEPSFLVNKAMMESKPVDKIEDSKQATVEFPKLPPIVLKLPFRRD
ncbi:PREDICTED: uncharacterized protein LOC104701024 [Camelina sativa]|uniref:Uncharacterized protein LOC104701024 n=1 Tax=Camelina sativa TaxID=90675 RepID=A0ABM0SR70_CAMSA|nr:PREDICTED: uncharacterized protein LOC104701024 [Camelina sativa]XP_010414950.1 PREDICTED: uncharacterized protein LOC104701024 [Camelina sativa]XP_010414951.1 PREDICTED: uncharacterized protein LOC104701024 [Camelina sativa]